MENSWPLCLLHFIKGTESQEQYSPGGKQLAIVFTALHKRDRVTRTKMHVVANTWPLCLLHFIKGTESQEQKCV